jgi:uroporphyrin-III C-methyltransferase
MEYAVRYGLKVTVIPGISSCIAVPSGQHIPVTKRGVSKSFWVITGTTSKHELCRDIALAARSSATVVILMGMAKLKEIVGIFSGEGKSDQPVAVIQNGTLANEKVGTGTISTILEVVEQEQLSNPAIIVIGEVVNHRDQLLKLRQECNSEILV